MSFQTGIYKEMTEREAKGGGSEQAEDAVRQRLNESMFIVF